MALEEGEESKSMLNSQQPAPTSELDMDESTPATTESGRSPRRKHCKAKQSIGSLYADANLCAAVRCFFSFPVLGSAIYILATYPRPGPNPVVMSFASYNLGCAISHISLAAHRIIRPPSPTSALPPRGYMVGLIISPVVLSVAFVFGLVLVALTKGYHGLRDMERLVGCGKRSSRQCHPLTPEAVAFELTIVCMSFAFVTLCCSLKQCYHVYCLSQNEYTAEEIQEAARSVNKLTFRSVMTDMLGAWYQRATRWKAAWVSPSC
ncbi:hypothetical protein N657DRAFT_205107 [Parathielavia appendiculata]|uniref:Uncharacterized protein n=1 Tax=Parathielavia appendiculata TaxID=2587402 RepID=A0AAN6U6E0_9PEZI|nr:hypothetical protein N657DRAFT_205107 [Parathielavia appendiculata]